MEEPFALNFWWMVLNNDGNFQIGIKIICPLTICKIPRMHLILVSIKKSLLK
jgi:hypothetical protein